MIFTGAIGFTSYYKVIVVEDLTKYKLISNELSYLLKYQKFLFLGFFL